MSPDIDELLKGHRDAITVKRVFGEPYRENGITIIPAARVMGGGGGGSGEQPDGMGPFRLWVWIDGELRRCIRHSGRGSHMAACHRREQDCGGNPYLPNVEARAWAEETSPLMAFYLGGSGG